MITLVHDPNAEPGIARFKPSPYIQGDLIAYVNLYDPHYVITQVRNPNDGETPYLALKAMGHKENP